MWCDLTLHIQSKTAADIRAFNPCEGGGEVIFLPGTQFHITKVNAATKESVGRGDLTMAERFTGQAKPENVVFFKIGDPIPRRLWPDGISIRNPTVLKAIATLTDEEILEWLKNIEGSRPEDIE
jgi:hypothetical protein